MDQMQPPTDNTGFSALFDFSFRSFITLSIIKVLYILGMLMIALIWLVVVIGAFSQDVLAGLAALVVGTIVAVVYLIFWRVSLELIVVVFRIGENTSQIVKMNQNSDGSPASS